MSAPVHELAVYGQLMDWSTVAISAIISAIVSTGFGLVTVSRSTVLQMRAQKREDARREVVAVARELQRELLRHQDSENPNGVRREAALEMDDFSRALRVVGPAQQLGLLRRWRVLLLAHRIFGAWVVGRARLMKDDSSDAAVVAWLGGELKHGGTPKRAGSWHLALAAPSASNEVKRGLRDLRLLEGRLI